MRRSFLTVPALLMSFLLVSIGHAQIDQPPVVTAPSTAVGSEGVLLEFDVSAIDPDGDPIASLNAAPIPAGATFTPDPGNLTGTFSWQPTFAQAGSYPIVFTASNVLSGDATTVIDVAETRTHANNPYAARLACGVSAATGELTFAQPPDPCLGGPMPLCFGIYYGSLLARTAQYESALGENWRGTYDWRLFTTATTADVEDSFGALYKFVAGPVGGWDLVEPTDLPHRLVQVGGELVFKHGETLRLYFFDPALGRLTKIQDLPGNQHTLAYDPASGRLLQVSDAFGRSLGFLYGPGGELTQVTDGARSTMFGYSGNLLTSRTDAAGKTTTFTYDTAHPIAGLLASITDPAGTTPLTYQYDPPGRVSAVVNAKAGSIALSYIDAGETTTTDSEGGVNSYRHNLPRRLHEHADPLGGITTWNYDPQGRVGDVSRPGGGQFIATTYDPVSGYPAAITYPGGVQVQFAYAAKSRLPGVVCHVLTTQTNPDLTQIQFQHDAAGNVLQVTDEAAQTWQVIRNPQGQPLQFTNPASGGFALGYDASGRVATRTEGAEVTSFAYDALDRLVTVTNPDLSTRSFTYDAMNRILTATDELSKTWTATYRDNGQITTVQDPLTHTTTYAYDNMNLLSSITDALAHAETYAYDDLGRLTSSTDRTGRTSTLTYDLLGRVATTSDPDLNATTYGYDAMSRLTSIAAPLGRTATFGYDARDRLTSVTDPLSQTTTFGYDDRNHLTSLLAPLGYSEIFTYNSRGLLQSAQSGPTSAQFAYSPLRQVTTYTDGDANPWLRGYDNRGRVTSQTDPLSRTETFAYDNRQRISGFTSTLGTATFTYDAADRMTQRSYSDGTVHNYTYDDLGQLLTTEGVTRTYDAVQRLLEQEGIFYFYDDAGRITSVTYGAGRSASYGYDTRGLPSTVTDWAGRTTQFQYDAAGRRTALIHPNGKTTSYAYDAADRLTHWAVTNVESIATASVEYDELGRVKSRFPWMSTGNEIAPIAPRTFAHDAASQIVGFSYDAMGRRLSDGDRTYTWDLASRMTSVTEGGETKTIDYDGLDQPIQFSLGADSGSHEYVNFRIRPMDTAGNCGNPAFFSKYYKFEVKGIYGEVLGVPANEEVWNFPLRSFAGAGKYALWDYCFGSGGSMSAPYIPGGGIVSAPISGASVGWTRFNPDGVPIRASVQTGLAELSTAPFEGTLHKNGSPALYSVREPSGGLLYTIDPSDSSALYHHVDDLGNVAFLTNDLGSITTTYAYAPDGVMTEHGWSPPNRQYTYQGGGPVFEERPGLYRVGTDLYDTKSVRKLPGRLKYTPPSLASKKLFVGNLPLAVPPSSGGRDIQGSPLAKRGKSYVKGLVNKAKAVSTDGPMPQTREHILLARQVGVPSSAGPMPQTREHILLGRQVGGATSGASAALGAVGSIPFAGGALAAGVVLAGDPVRIQTCVNFTGSAPVGHDSDRFNGRYYVTGSRHIYLPDAGGYRSLFRLGHTTHQTGDGGNHELGHALGL